jgi:magnesium transporter
MSTTTVLDIAEPPFRWIDLVEPSSDELQAAATEYGLFPTLVADSLEPEHLPKYERVGDVTFVIVRAFDEQAPADGATVQALTRKVAIFASDRCLITIHRKELPWLSRFRDDAVARAKRTPPKAERRQSWPVRLLLGIVNAAVDTYEAPLEQIEHRLDEIEDEIFLDLRGAELLRELHQLKRRGTLMRRMLWHTQSSVVKLTPVNSPSQSLYQDARESVESMFSYAEVLTDTATNLMHIFLGLSANRTNVIMRVLTVFSVFFLPLTFLVGVYGMNFEFMPELRSRWGYPMALGAMAVITLAIYLWFRRRGWLRE